MLKLKLRRHFNLWCYACLNLSRFKSHTLAVCIPLTLAMTFTTAISIIRDGFGRDAQASVRLLPDITVQKPVGGHAERMSDSYVAVIEKMPQIRKVLPRVWGYLPVTVNQQDFVLTLMSQTKGESDSYGQVRGQMTTAQPGDCVIGEGVAKLLKVKPGQKLALKSYSGREHGLKITGVLHSQSQIYGADLIITHSTTARRLLGYQPGELSDIGVMVRDKSQLDSVAAAMAKSYPELRIVSKATLDDVTQQAYSGRAGLFQLVWLILLATVLLTVWAQGTAMSAGLTREVGILKALGWTTGDIITVKVWESVILGLTGTLAGLVGAISYILLGAPELRGFFLGWTALFPETKIPIAIEPSSMIALVSTGVLPLLMVTIMPIWRLSITDPDEALRS